MALTQVTKSGITADAIDATKIADNAVDSEHLAADSIDAEHYAAGSVDATAIANDAVDSQHLAADSIDAEHYAAGSVDVTALGADAVTAAKIGDDVINSEHYAATSVDNAHINDVAASKLTGALPAISGASLTNLPSKGKNIIINGEMQIAQRDNGTVAQADGSNEGYATLDRWSMQFGNSAGGTITTSRDGETPAGFGYSYKLNVTTADGSISGNEIVYASQHIEAHNLRSCGWEYTSSSSDITLSFWVRNSKTGIYCIAFFAADSGSRMYTAEYTVSSADTWEKKTIVIPGESNLVFNEDTGSGLELLFMLANASGRYGAAGSWTTGNHYGTSNQVNFLDSTSNIMYLTGVKLEIGDTATDYVHKSYGEELSLCQRYFINIHSNIPFGGFANNANTQFGVALPVPLRGSPTASLSAGNKTTWRHTGSQDSTETAVTTAQWGADRNIIGLQVAGFSGNTDGYAVNFGTGQGILSLDSEL